MGAVVKADAATLSRDEARSLTDEVKNDAERLWLKLVELYEGNAHTALGYASWDGYFSAEFGGSKARAYQILDAGRVARELQSTNGGLVNERQARELAPLLKQPEKLRETWAEVVQHNPEPTAADVREVVSQKLPPKSRKTEINEAAARRKLFDALARVNGYCLAFDEFNVARAVAGATPDDVAAWERLAGESVAALNRLRRAVKEAR